MTIVEVFKTNVADEAPAKELVSRLLTIFPTHRINFDLQDCDKILRVEGAKIEGARIMNVIKSHGYFCDFLEG
jgi:hypothetical protein